MLLMAWLIKGVSDMLYIQNKVENAFYGMDSDINTIFIDAIHDGVTDLAGLKEFSQIWLGKFYNTEVLEFIIDMELTEC